MSKKYLPQDRKSLFRQLRMCALLAVLALLFWLLLFPASIRRQLDGVCLVESSARYALPLPAGDTLWFSPRGRVCTAAGDSLRGDSATASGFFVSNEGHLVTSAALLRFAPDSLPPDTVRAWLEREKTRLEQLLKKKEKEGGELDYYAATHSVIDDGYNEVMAYRTLSAGQKSRVGRLLQQVTAALQQPTAAARLHDSYRIVCVLPRGADSVSRHTVVALRRQRADSLLLLQTADQALPHDAFRFVVYATGVPRWRPRLMGFFGPTSLPDAALADSARYLTAPQLEGAPVVNLFGQLCGVRCDGKVRPAASVRALYFAERNWPEWAWANGLRAVRRFFTFAPTRPDTVYATPGRPPRNVSRLMHVGKAYGRLALPQGEYCGRMADGRPEGFGALRYRDGSVHTGLWQAGRREGYGRLRTDSAVYAGHWQGDTLAAGTRRDSIGLYRGQLNHNLQPDGAGSLTQHNGIFYRGNWQAGRREGFGFAVSERHIVQAGIWKKDRFQGEQIIYTANRIYGIDISRYQHEIGRRVYRIDWSKLRISSLGTASRKRIHGEQDYPVSFIYIKATQSNYIRNRYYAADIAAARRRNIPAGAYHFFSTRRSGKVQARYFLRIASPRRGDLPPVLDVEPYDSQIRAMGGIDVLFREVLQWMRAVEQHCGTRPILYVSQNFVNKYMEHAPATLSRYPVWIARYGEYKPYVRLLYWQLAADGRVKGIRGAVDINVYNGSREQFETFVREECVKRGK